MSNYVFVTPNDPATDWVAPKWLVRAVNGSFFALAVIWFAGSILAFSMWGGAIICAVLNPFTLDDWAESYPMFLRPEFTNGIIVSAPLTVPIALRYTEWSINSLYSGLGNGPFFKRRRR